MKRPGQHYHPSTRSMPKRIEPYDYASHYLVRRVSRCGTIRVLRKQVLVSQTLNEDYVGLEEVGDGVYDLFFCFYHIGRYQLHSNKIHDIVSRVGVSRRQVDLASRVLPMSWECTGRPHNNSPDCVKTRACGAPAPRMALGEARSGGGPRVLPRLLGSKWERDWRIRGFHTASRWSGPGWRAGSWSVPCPPSCARMSRPIPEPPGRWPTGLLTCTAPAVRRRCRCCEARGR
jgi:hypothetical protein